MSEPFVTKDNVAAVLKRIKGLTKKEVLIGIPATNAARDAEAAERGDKPPITNAVIGYVNEFGSPAQNIPPRPHLIPGVESILPDAIKRLKHAAKQAMNGDASEPEKQFHAIGLKGQAAVRRKIDEGPFQALAAPTLAARKRRGRTGEKPLMDTGQYRRAQNYVIHEKGK